MEKDWDLATHLRLARQLGRVVELYVARATNPGDWAYDQEAARPTVRPPQHVVGLEQALLRHFPTRVVHCACGEAMDKHAQKTAAVVDALKTGEHTENKRNQAGPMKTKEIKQALQKATLDYIQSTTRPIDWISFGHDGRSAPIARVPRYVAVWRDAICQVYPQPTARAVWETVEEYRAHIGSHLPSYFTTPQ